VEDGSMYLLSHLWWYLLLAFSLGALIGYFLWRLCSRPMLESRYERSRKDLSWRLHNLEEERANFVSTGGGTGTDSSGELAKLRSELAAAKQRTGTDDADRQKLTQSLVASHETEVRKAREEAAAEAARKHADELKKAREQAAAEFNTKHADELKKARDQVTAEWTTKHNAELKKAREEVTASLAAAHAGEVKKLQEAARAHESKVMLLSQADTSARQELDAVKARQADELKKTREQVAAEWTAKHAADVKKAREDAAAEAARHHAEDVKKARDHVTAEWTTKHNSELKKARDEVTASLAAAHAGEVKKLQETAKAHESKVMLLSQADTSARQELDAAKTRHADELKKTRDQVAAEWTAKHAADVKKAREDAAAEAARHHAEEVKKARDQVAAEWTTKHASELKKARDEVSASLSSTHAADIKKAREDAAAEAARKHADELKKASDQVVAQWTAKHAADVKKAREDATVEAARHHAEDLAKAKAAAAASASGAHDAALKAEREAAVAEAARRHNEEIAKLNSDHSAALARHTEELAKARATAVAAVAIPTVAAVSAPAAKAKADDLKLIWGVGPEIEKLLNQNGIHRFEQMANWTSKDVSWFEGLLPAFKGRPESEKWVEQCKKLASGWRPEREIGDKPKDILTSARGGKADDLKLIWGVGPKLEVMLNKAGFYHFDQIAKWTDREIEWVDTQLGDFAGRAVRDKWVEQCKKLATGWRPTSEVGDKPT
jgi:predicted flap endonuclease-1-like 5' DNA nuclease